VVLALLGVGWGLWRGQRARYEVSLARSEAESEARFRSLIESAPVAISIVRSGEILYANPACIRLFGHERLEDFEGRPVLSHMAPESHPQLTERRRRRERGEAIPSVFETMGRRRDGSPLPLLVEVADLQLPDGLATLVFLRDMTELRRAELERRRLAAAIEQSAETVVITDAEGTIEYVNPAFERITGYSREEALGQNPRLLKSGNHAPEFYREMWSTLLRGEAWSGRLVNKRRDGTLYEEEATISPVRDESGRIAHFVAVKRDVTERQRLEARLLQAQKMESVGRLAGGVAHDFNNLLSVILGYTGLILRRLPEPDPLRPRITEIHKAGERAAALTRQLLAFSRRQVLQPVVMDLNATVENLEKMLRRLIGEDIDLSTLLDRRAGLIRADPSQVEQVIVNLAVNARDAMPRGGRLTIETAPAVLDEAYTSARPGVRPGRHVALVVSDNGSGMDAETQAHLFEPFFTTKEQGKGTGLGLATVYGIVEQSGGHITFESRVDHGTTFRIYFPRVEGEAAFVAGPPPAEDEARGTETVLIVEDEEMLRDFAVQVLRLHGYQVLEAADGADALRLLERHPEAVDLVVTDVVMPRMSGPELAHRLTRKRPGVKVLFLSGYAGPDIAQHGLPEAGSAFLAKPFTPDALARKVREVLDEPSGSGSLTPSDPRP
jgi:PAS domain S-box-containing protein